MFPNRQLKFSPDDRVLDVYRALYPDCTLPDDLELETLARPYYSISTALISPQFGVTTLRWGSFMLKPSRLNE
jgi:hypothetical protein